MNTLKYIFKIFFRAFRDFRISVIKQFFPAFHDFRVYVTTMGSVLLFELQSPHQIDFPAVEGEELVWQ